MAKYDETWNLEPLFPGGSSSTEYLDFQKEIITDFQKMEQKWPEFEQGLNEDTQPTWVQMILLLQDIEEKLYQASSFVYCLLAQDVKDEKANQLYNQQSELETRMNVWQTQVQAQFGQQDDRAWQTLMNHPELREIRFQLDTDRKFASQRMAPEKETLVEELATDGYRAWGKLYDRIAGKLKAEFEHDGEVTELSMGQLSSKMAHPKRAVRQQALEKLEETWKTVKHETAMALNHLGGFRHTMYRHRGWDDITKESLHMNRVSRETIDTMWDVIQTANPQLKDYFTYKAKLLGIDQLAWYDVQAPLGTSDRAYSYDEASDFVITQLGGFSPEMADFARHAIENQWIEAEDRTGKRAGGFCTGFPLSAETRIFMTFTGTYNNLSTLAHELGHAYHSWVLRDEPMFNQSYPMALAETASTFAETVVADGAFKVAQSDAEKLYLLDIQLQSAVSFFMNLQARYIFELAYYDERKKGFVDADRLSELMVDAQQNAYCQFLDKNELHPLFWASKMHFYFAEQPFYNYPYTFGFLFSNGIYNQAKKEGSDFADRYDALLRDTGRMTCEHVAHEHLKVDLTQPEFWQGAVSEALSKIDPFVKLAKKLA